MGGIKERQRVAVGRRAAQRGEVGEAGEAGSNA